MAALADCNDNTTMQVQLLSAGHCTTEYPPTRLRHAPSLVLWASQAIERPAHLSYLTCSPVTTACCRPLHPSGRPSMLSALVRRSGCKSTGAPQNPPLNPLTWQRQRLHLPRLYHFSRQAAKLYDLHRPRPLLLRLRYDISRAVPSASPLQPRRMLLTRE